MTELQRLIMLYTGDKPDGSRVRGEWGLSSEDHQRLTNLLIEENKRLTGELDSDYAMPTKPEREWTVEDYKDYAMAARQKRALMSKRIKELESK